MLALPRCSALQARFSHLVVPGCRYRGCHTFAKKDDKYDAEYYKGMFSSPLEQRYTRGGEQNSDTDMLVRNLKLAGYSAAFLAALVIAFLWSNGVF